METKIKMTLSRPTLPWADRSGCIWVDVVADVRMGGAADFGAERGFVTGGIRALVGSAEIALSEHELRAARALLVGAYLHASGVRPGPAYAPTTSCERETWCILRHGHSGKCNSTFM